MAGKTLVTVASAATVTLSALLVGGVVTATVSQGDSSVIVACLDQRSGQLRVIEPELQQSCSRRERSIEWNEQGPKGDQGVAGPEGPAGAPASIRDFFGVLCHAPDGLDPTTPTSTLAMPAALYTSMSVERRSSFNAAQVAVTGVNLGEGRTYADTNGCVWIAWDDSRLGAAPIAALSALAGGPVIFTNPSSWGWWDWKAPTLG